MADWSKRVPAALSFVRAPDKKPAASGLWKGEEKGESRGWRDTCFWKGKREDDLPERVEDDAVTTENREEVLLRPTRDGAVLALVNRWLDPAVLLAKGDILIQEIGLEV